MCLSGHRHGRRALFLPAGDARLEIRVVFWTLCQAVPFYLGYVPRLFLSATIRNQMQGGQGVSDLRRHGQAAPLSNPR